MYPWINTLLTHVPGLIESLSALVIPRGPGMG